MTGAAPPAHPKSTLSSRSHDKPGHTQPFPKYSLGHDLVLMTVIGLDKHNFYHVMAYFSCCYPPIFTSFKWNHFTCTLVSCLNGPGLHFTAHHAQAHVLIFSRHCHLYKNSLLLVLIFLKNLCFVGDYEW